MYKDLKDILKERKRIYNGSKSKNLRKLKLKQMRYGYSFVLPAIIITAIFTLAATIIGFYLTFREGSILNNKASDVSAWKKVFTSPYYLNNLKNSFRNTFIFTGITSSLTLIIALLITSILNTGKVKGKNFFLSLYFLPQVSASIATAIIFVSMMGPTGFLKIDFNENKFGALWVIIANSVWGGVAGTIIIYNTAFSGIEQSQYEAASIDGAGAFIKFFKITLPNLSNILIFSLFTSFIGGLSVFDAPYILTRVNGSLANNPYLQTVAYFGYSHSMALNGVTANVGIGMVILFFLSAIILLLTFIVNKIKPIEKGVK